MEYQDKTMPLLSADEASINIPNRIEDWYVFNGITKGTKVVAKVGYGLGLFSSVFVVFLGKEFATKLSWPKGVAYTVSCFSAVPLSLLLAQQASTILTLLFQTSFPLRSQLFKQIRPKQASKQRIKNAFLALLALTPAVPLTYLAHQQILENTHSKSLAIILDIPAFFPRWALFYWAANLALDRIRLLIKKIFIAIGCAMASNDSTIQHLLKTKIVLEYMTDSEVQSFFAKDYLDKDTAGEKIIALTSLPDKKAELVQAQHWMIEISLNVLALLIGVAAAYVIKPLAVECYEEFSDLLGIRPEKTDQLGTVGAWIGMSTFSLLIYNAVSISFQRYYSTSLQLIRQSRLPPTSASDNVDQSHSLLSATLVVIASILAFISVFPRVQINNLELTHLSDNMRLAINIGASIGFFSLDFWPLSDNLLNYFNKNHIARKALTLSVIKLAKGFAQMKEDVQQSFTENFAPSMSA